MSNGIPEELEYDPLNWWVEITEWWNAHGFKNWMCSGTLDRSPELSSEEDEEYTFVNWNGLHTNSWASGN